MPDEFKHKIEEENPKQNEQQKPEEKSNKPQQ